MNLFLTPMTGLIHDNRGTIDKYMGDAIMAFWGAPIGDPDHPRHAVETGMRMLAGLGPINQDFKNHGWPEIRIGVGINTSEMSVGNMGFEFRKAYTVLGEAVNFGSRLEGLTKSYGVSIMVSESTRMAVPEFAYRELDKVRVKGKDEPVTVYEPLGVKDEIGKSVNDELGLYRQAIKFYRVQQWDMAELQFINLQKMAASPILYKVYADRVAQYRANPLGKDWDGVFTHTSK
jgi:adenylate cyclase